MKRLARFVLLIAVAIFSGHESFSQLIITNDTTICPGSTVQLQATASNTNGVDITSDDVYSSFITLPFIFKFYGIDYGYCKLSSNGYISFDNVPAIGSGDVTGGGGSSAWSITQGIPGNPNVKNSIMGMYADIYPPAGGNIYYSTYGAAPNRRFIVTFCNVAMFSCTSLHTTFQMVLKETSNEIEFHIQEAPTSSCSWNGGRAIQGVQNANATVATWTTIPQVRNYPNSWSTNDDGQLYTPNASGTSYTVSQIPFYLEPTYPSITWYQNGTTNLGTSPNINVSPSTTTFYVASPTTAGGCYTSIPADTVWVYVGTSAVPTAQPDVTYCQGEPATQLTATPTDPAANLLWYTAPTGGLGSANAPTPNTATAGTYNYYVSQVLNGCESTTRDVVTVTVLATPPAPAVVPTVVYCQDAPAAQLTAPGSNLLWYTSATDTSGDPVAPTPGTATPGNTTWYVTSTGPSGCESQKASITVTVNATPALPTVVTPVEVCQESPAVPIQATGTGLLWYDAATGGAGVASTPTYNTNLAYQDTFYVSQTILNCEGPRASIALTVFPKPAPPVVTDSVFICQNTPSFPLEAIGYDIIWYTTPVAGVGSVEPPVPSVISAGFTAYYATQTSADGCESNRARTVVEIKPQVIAEINLDKPLLCNNDTLNVYFTGIAPSQASYMWDFASGEIRNGATGDGPYYIYYKTPGDYTINLMIDSRGCRDTTEKTVRVDAPPPAFFNLVPEACKDQMVYIQAGWESTWQDGYQWDFGDAQITNGNGQGTYEASWSTTGDKVVGLVVTIGACRSLPVYDTIHINELPVANIQSIKPDGPYCQGDTLQVNPYAINGYRYEWGPTNYLIRHGDMTMTDSFQTTPQAWFVPRSDMTITLTVVDSNGCTASTRQDIDTEPCCQIALPSAFSPNGDGRNDAFRIITDGHQALGTFRILNRWGVTVFQTQDPRHGWDGTMNGIPQDMGTYMYYISYRCNGKDVEQQGDLTLVR